MFKYFDKLDCAFTFKSFPLKGVISVTQRVVIFNNTVIDTTALHPHPQIDVTTKHFKSVVETQFFDRLLKIIETREI